VQWLVVLIGRNLDGGVTAELRQTGPGTATREATHDLGPGAENRLALLRADRQLRDDASVIGSPDGMDSKLASGNA
jgi:hypothetical protein